jgi:RNA polymerase sigma factor for flagellar operon FliA
MGFAEKKLSEGYGNSRELRERLILEYLPYVKRVVQRLAAQLPPSVDQEDLVNAGIIGLIQAVDRYDPTHETKFITYAVYRIRGSVLSELRSRDYLSRATRKKIRELEKTCLMLEQRLGREAEDDEIAAEMGIDLEQMFNLKKMAGISFVTYEEMGFNSYNEKKGLMNYILKSETEDALDLTRIKEMKNAVARAIGQLDERDRLVMTLYYYEEMTMKEIGMVLNITESRVSQIHSQAVMRLRSKLRKEGLFGDGP